MYLELSCRQALANGVILDHFLLEVHVVECIPCTYMFYLDITKHIL